MTTLPDIKDVDFEKLAVALYDAARINQYLDRSEIILKVIGQQLNIDFSDINASLFSMLLLEDVIFATEREVLLSKIVNVLVDTNVI